MTLTDFRAKYQSPLSQVGDGLEELEAILDEVQNEGDNLTAASSELAAVQFAYTKLARALEKITDEDLEEDELADRKDDEDEDEETESA